MIEFYRDGTKVGVRITAKYPIQGWKYSLWFDCNREDHALLLHNNFAEAFGALVSEIRGKAYNEGWKDAKAKAKKKTWFSRWFG